MHELLELPLAGLAVEGSWDYLRSLPLVRVLVKEDVPDVILSIVVDEPVSGQTVC